MVAGAHQASVEIAFVGVNIGAKGEKVGIIFMVVVDGVGEGRSKCFWFTRAFRLVRHILCKGRSFCCRVLSCLLLAIALVLVTGVSVGDLVGDRSGCVISRLLPLQLLKTAAIASGMVGADVLMIAAGFAGPVILLAFFA